MRAAHAAFCLGLAERDQRTMAWSEMAAWFDRLQAEHDNLRAALAWLERSGDVAGLLRLAGNLAWFWLYRSHRAEGRRWLERALAAAREADVPDGVRAWALHGAALLTRTQNDASQAERLGEEALRLYRGLGDAWGTAVALNLLGALARSRGRLRCGAGVRRGGVAPVRGVGDGAVGGAGAGPPRDRRPLAGRRRRCRTASRRRVGRAPRAERPDRVGHRPPLAGGGGRRPGDHARAAALEREGLAAAGAAGAKEAQIDGVAGVATVAAGLGQMEAAARLLGAVGANCERLGYTFERPERERYDRAARVAREALGDAAFARAETAGRALSLEEAVAEATAFAPMAGPAGVPAPTGAAARHGLTAREVEVLRLLAQRRTDREIADALFISPKTAGFHVANILGKLGVANRREAAALALREGLTVAPS